MLPFMFWWLEVLDSHEALVKRFGRYPSRNGLLEERRDGRRAGLLESDA